MVRQARRYKGEPKTQQVPPLRRPRAETARRKKRPAPVGMTPAGVRDDKLFSSGAVVSERKVRTALPSDDRRATMGIESIELSL